jgi:hypothetical protein
MPPIKILPSAEEVMLSGKIFSPGTISSPPPVELVAGAAAQGALG